MPTCPRWDLNPGFRRSPKPFFLLRKERKSPVHPKKEKLETAAVKLYRA